MKLTRREVLAGAAAGVVGAGGIYELVDQLSGGRRAPGRRAAPPEQHLLDGVRVVRSDGVEVLVPPLHHEIVTARVVQRTDLRTPGLVRAGARQLDADYAPTPAGLGVTVAWGLPYFQRVEAAALRLLPQDRRAGRPVLCNAQRFPSDPFDRAREERRRNPPPQRPAGAHRRRTKRIRTRSC